MEKQRLGKQNFAKNALVMSLVMLFGMGGTLLLDAFVLKLGIPEWLIAGSWGGFGIYLADLLFPWRPFGAEHMESPRKSIKEVGIWRALSWPGILAFAIGPFATLYLLENIFSVEFAHAPYEIQLLWLCPFLILHTRKQRRLGLYSEKWFTGEPKTRWQAFVNRGSVWTDSTGILLAILPLVVVFVGSRYIVALFELSVNPLVIATPAFLVLAIAVISIRGRWRWRESRQLTQGRHIPD